MNALLKASILSDKMRISHLFIKEFSLIRCFLLVKRTISPCRTVGNITMSLWSLNKIIHCCFPDLYSGSSSCPLRPNHYIFQWCGFLLLSRT
ncbi:hypothetical protein HanRHA438_Chr06g0286791 [Helianthus annuus]|nr:hypothetical protein HanIR_Chr06g0298691 [Helianthus annuus]KAJ0913543.1 hypothetical protein HanRHA438_Chr06g0286791 [Helianthus annuus]